LARWGSGRLWEAAARFLRTKFRFSFTGRFEGLHGICSAPGIAHSRDHHESYPTTPGRPRSTQANMVKRSREVYNLGEVQ
jgi:hypothetical protein